VRKTALVVIASLGLACSVVPLAAHATACTNASLKGAYGVIERGGFPIPVITSTFDSVGIFTFPGVERTTTGTKIRIE
jgi:hypothetical protein